MTSKEFVIWLQGFTQGIEEYNITPTPLQWNVIKGKLTEVNDGQPIGVGGWGVPNTQPFVMPTIEPHLVNVPNLTPNGTSPSPYFVTPSTPGITISNPPFGFGSTSTAYGYPSGSAWSYTSTQKEPYTTGGPDEVIKHHNED